jgi:hypothetical protein
MKEGAARMAEEQRAADWAQDLDRFCRLVLVAPAARQAAPFT